MSNILVVDNTWAEAHRACWRKGYYRHGLGLTTATTAAPLSFGGAIHAGIAAWRKGKGKEEACATAIKAWRVMPGDEENWRTPDKLLEVLDQYIDNENNDIPIIKGTSGLPLVEVDAAYPLLTLADSDKVRDKLNGCGYDDVVFVGLIDAIVEWMGQPTVLDTKTTSGIFSPKDTPSNIRPQFWDGFRPGKQMLGYLWIVSQYLNQPIHNVVIDAIGLHKTGSRNCFERRDFIFTPSQLEEWRKDTVSLVDQWLDCKINDYWPMNGAPYYCHSYGSECVYCRMCSVPPENRKELEPLYVVDRWEPMEARKKEAATL